MPILGFCYCDFVQNGSLFRFLSVVLVQRATLCIVFVRICCRINDIDCNFHFFFASIWIGYYNRSCGFSRCIRVHWCLPIIRCSFRKIVFVLDSGFCAWVFAFIDIHLLSFRNIGILCFPVSDRYGSIFLGSVCVGYFHGHGLVCTICSRSRNLTFDRFGFHFLCWCRSLLPILGFCYCDFVQNCSLFRFLSVVLVQRTTLYIVFVRIWCSECKWVSHNGIVCIWTICNQNNLCTIWHYVCVNIQREISGYQILIWNLDCTIFISGVCFRIFIIALKLDDYISSIFICDLDQSCRVCWISNQCLWNSSFDRCLFSGIECCRCSSWF